MSTLTGTKRLHLLSQAIRIPVQCGWSTGYRRSQELPTARLKPTAVVEHRLSVVPKFVENLPDMAKVTSGALRYKRVPLLFCYSFTSAWDLGYTMLAC